jgi:peptidoglycan/xylan/chitin deacetylase (PgdA/CDA1 family)
MYQQTLLTGRSLRPHELCLTYDDGPGESSPDGPGPRTLHLAEVLSDHAVPATFFVVGKHVEEHPGTVERLRALGHDVANHTFHHPDLADLAAAGGDVAAELGSTDPLLRSQGRPVFVRPPYGSWSPTVADQLNARLLTALDHVGPVGWDVNADDWACWRDGVGPEQAAERYLAAALAADRGIVLMHDSTADGEQTRARNRTARLTEILLPRLLEQDFRFVALHEVPELRELAAAPFRIRLVAGSERVEMTVERRGPGKVALRTPDGRYLTRRDDGSVEPGPELPGSAEAFDVLPVGDGIALRTVRGDHVTATEGRLRATDTRLGHGDVFGWSPA